jgi:hypothetical protein
MRAFFVPSESESICSRRKNEQFHEINKLTTGNQHATALTLSSFHDSKIQQAAYMGGFLLRH